MLNEGKETNDGVNNKGKTKNMQNMELLRNKEAERIESFKKEAKKSQGIYHISNKMRSHQIIFGTSCIKRGIF